MTTPVSMTRSSVPGRVSRFHPWGQRLLAPNLPLLEVLRHHVRWSVRATCRLFCSELEAGREELRIRWPAVAAAREAAGDGADGVTLRLSVLLARRPRLVTLLASGCPQHHASSVFALPGLTQLMLGSSGEVSTLGPPAQCTALRLLVLSNCPKLVDIGALRTCHALTSLNLRSCSALVDISALAACPHLTSLDLCGCSVLVDVAPLSARPPRCITRCGRWQPRASWWGRTRRVLIAHDLEYEWLPSSCRH